MTCPACKSTQLTVEQCENDHGDYTAHVCLACSWRSDTPEPTAARGDHIGYCEGCHLPIRAGELYLLYGDDIVTHCECPKAAQA